jgi:nicotinate dehydrogenase subunit B
MTGLLHANEFSRRSFVKGGGALILGFSLAGAGLVGKAQAAGDPNQFSSYGPLDSTQIDSWLVVHPDNMISVKLGRVEIGQGSTTAFAMIAAEELNHDITLMRVIPSDTDLTPNLGSTSNSSSVQTAGKSLRAAAAAGYQALLAIASTKLNVPVSSLSVTNGVVSGGGTTVTYGQLINGGLFNVQAAPAYNLALNGGAPPIPPATAATAQSAGAGLAPGFPGLTKPVSRYTIIGVTSPPRIDIPAKVMGTYTYVHNIHIPGMLHGRVVRPRGQGAYGSGTSPQVLSLDLASIAHLPGTKVLRKGNFVGVVAPTEFAAIGAAAQLKVTWAAMPALPGTPGLWNQMRQQDSAGQAPAAIKSTVGNVNTALAGAAHVVTQTYKYNYNAHVPIGPSCCVADVTQNGARIYSNTQNAYATRTNVANVLGFAMNQVRVSYYEGSSVYGTSPYEDVAEAAAVMSQLAGAPVRLQFMRWDENGYDNYGSPMMHDIQVAADANGNLLAASTTEFAPPYYSTTPTQGLVGFTPAFGTTMPVDTTNAGTQYNVPNRQVISKSLPLQNNYFKTSFLRAPQAPQTCFAFEQCIDELAHAANMDPYTFRLNNIATLASDQALALTSLTWDRWKGVLTLVGKISNWQPKVANSVKQTGNIVTGRGIALGSFAGSMIAEVADITVNKYSGKVLVNHVYAAQDTGLTHYPDGIENQAVGAITQGASRALLEEVTFSKSNVTSLDWVTYQIMRFADAPKITFVFNQRYDIPATNTGTVQSNGQTAPSSTTSASGVYSSGSGEVASTCIGAAIANAFFDATGVRIREAPMIAGRVRAVLKAGGATN